MLGYNNCNEPSIKKDIKNKETTIETMIQKTKYEYGFSTNSASFE